MSEATRAGLVPQSLLPPRGTTLSANARISAGGCKQFSTAERVPGPCTAVALL